MFKKKIALLTLSAVMTGMLAGCGGGAEKAAGSETAEAAAAKPDKKIVIKYWYAFGDKIEEAKQHMVQTFNESQDKIEVVAEHQGNYDDLHAKVQAAFAAGDAPAVTDLEIASTGVFAHSGMLEDLTSYAEKDKDQLKLDDFIPG
ncbi:extracellular solute-binding protein [Paenibacillus sp. AR247]|nr:extracellular solute-binding protein [Paenibacillus sp. AR247]